MRACAEKGVSGTARWNATLSPVSSTSVARGTPAPATGVERRGWRVEETVMEATEMGILYSFLTRRYCIESWRVRYRETLLFGKLEELDDH